MSLSLLVRSTFKMVVDTIPEVKMVKNYSLKSTFTYEDAIKALNNLQSNASVLQQSKTRAHNVACKNIDETKKYMFRCGISMSKLNSLSVIHVAGTKGKGTTCALSESILRSHGFRTGFFSSPHLICVTERIRLCGKPINRDVFVHYFETVYKALESKQEYSNDMPPYFKFLTILAFKIFICEGVDVAVIEVGIGGEHDCTNVLRNVSTVGITSLGIEHTSILGNTIEEIAWQKAGIMKPGCQAFTVPQKYSSAMKVLEKRAEENNIPLTVVPSHESYKFLNQLGLQIETEAQKLNLSLAIQISNNWMQRYHLEVKSNDVYTPNYKSDIILDIDEAYLRGINRLSWLGRYQIIPWRTLKVYLDGAHTIESLETCVEWFMKKTSVNVNRPKVIIFNATGDRNSSMLLKKLAMQCHFNSAIFVPNAAHADRSLLNDQNNYSMPLNMQMERCYEHRDSWNKIMKEKLEDIELNINTSRNNSSTTSDNSVTKSILPNSVMNQDKHKIQMKLPVQNGAGNFLLTKNISIYNNHIRENCDTELLHTNNTNTRICTDDVKLKVLNHNWECHVFDSVRTALDFASQHYTVCDVLVTGSLHLIGATLIALEHNSANG